MSIIMTFNYVCFSNRLFYKYQTIWDQEKHTPSYSTQTRKFEKDIFLCLEGVRWGAEEGHWPFSPPFTPAKENF